MPARRRKPCRGGQEDAAMASRRWAGLQEQNRLIALNHSPEANKKAQQRCRAFLEGGYGAVSWD